MNHDVALWSGLSAFCGSMIGLKVLDLISGELWVQLLAAVVSSVIVGGGVYCQQRLAEAKRRPPHDEIQG